MSVLFNSAKPFRSQANSLPEAKVPTGAWNFLSLKLSVHGT